MQEVPLLHGGTGVPLQEHAGLLAWLESSCVYNYTMYTNVRGNVSGTARGLKLALG